MPEEQIKEHETDGNNTGDIQRIESDIKATRNKLDSRVDELSNRFSADHIKAQAVEGWDRLKHGVSKNVSESYDDIKHRVQDGYRTGRDSAQRNYEQHPLLACGIAFGAGILLGAALPVSRMERRTLGASAARVRQTVDKRTSRLIDKGKEKLEKSGNGQIRTDDENRSVGEQQSTASDTIGRDIVH